MNSLRSMYWKLNSLWLKLRYKYYCHKVNVPKPLKPSGGDDTANIQRAINRASETPAWFDEIESAYKRKWYRFFIRKPILRSTAMFEPGVYNIHQPIVISQSEAEITGAKTVISSPSGKRL